MRNLIPCLLALAACGALEEADNVDRMVDHEPMPPMAEQRSHVLETHGHVRNDEYYWLNQREDPDVLAYLESENDFLAAKMADTTALQGELYEELVARRKDDDSTVPVAYGGYHYYSRYVEGGSYPLHCRRAGSMEGDEEVLLDLNALAEGHGYYSIASRSPSPDQSQLAYAVDTVGRRIYDIEVKDLTTGEVTDRIAAATSNLTWAEDGKHLFYARRDLETLRTYQIWRHALGTDPADDVLVFQEDEEEFSCFVTKTRSKQLLLIGSRQTLSNEWRMLDASNPTGEWSVVLPRERGHEYDVDHHGESLVIRTNRDAPNFKLVVAPLNDASEANWKEFIPHREDVLIEGYELSARHMVVIERATGLRRLRVRSLTARDEHEVSFEDPTYSLSLGANPEWDTSLLRFNYSSLTTPGSVYDYDLDSQEKTLLKRDEVLGGFDPANYKSERIWASARDGTQVPVSLVYRMPFEADGSRPLLQYGYGSYGSSMDARFNTNVVSLLDRGWVYAIAHIRGGEEMGRQWYEDGKLLKKKNTFTDFIDCGEHLVAEGYTSPERLCAMGGSAGGLLVGAVINMRPDLYEAVIAHVPFVDVVTTMLDETIPLTTFEWDEWGNPKDKTYYDYMLSYSPYDQVGALDYPHLLVTTGLHDSQVQYFEPAKWVARLRERKVGEHDLLFKCKMEAGHGGASGRYDRYKDTALDYAFLLTRIQP